MVGDPWIHDEPLRGDRGSHPIAPWSPPFFWGDVSKVFHHCWARFFQVFPPISQRYCWLLPLGRNPTKDGKYVDLFLGRLRTSSLPFSSAPPRDSSLRSRKIAKTMGSDKNIFFFWFWQEIHTFDGQNPWFQERFTSNQSIQNSKRQGLFFQKKLRRPEGIDLQMCRHGCVVGNTRQNSCGRSLGVLSINSRYRWLCAIFQYPWERP